MSCELKTFTINGKNADSMDFGDAYDHDKENAAPYGCGCVYFEPKLPTSDVLKYYSITVDDYNIVCRELENKLYVGKCGWCI